MGSFKDFLGNLFGTKSKNVSGEVISSDIESDEICTGVINAFALYSVTDMVASMCALAELKTYTDGKPFKGYEWYNLNIRPNVNQSGTEFWKEAYCKLLTAGELLIIPVGDQKIIADSFTKEDLALRDSIFRGVSRGSFTFNRSFTASEVFYIKYSNARVKAMLGDISSVYSKLFNEAANNYVKNGGQKATIEVSTLPTGNTRLEDDYNKAMNDRLKSFVKAKDATLTLFEGMKFNPVSLGSSGGNIISDIRNIFDEALTRAAQAYKMPPQLVRGEVSGIDDAVNYMLTVCIDPLLNAVSEELSGKEFSPAEYIAGNYIAADSTNIKHIDIFSLAPNIEKLISSAFMNVDEVRERSGVFPTGEDWAQIHYITKNFERVQDLYKSGDLNAES